MPVWKPALQAFEPGAQQRLALRGLADTPEGGAGVHAGQQRPRKVAPCAAIEVAERFLAELCRAGGLTPPTREIARHVQCGPEITLADLLGAQLQPVSFISPGNGIQAAL